MLIIGYEGFKKIRGALYQKMVQQALALSDAVMLVYEFANHTNGDCAEKMRDMRSMLMPYLLHTRNNGECTLEKPYFDWPGTRRGYRDPTDPAEEFYSGESQTYVDTYAISDIVKDVIVSVDALIDWWPKKNATDIAFFKDGECWFGTTVHEYGMWIDDHEDVFSEMFDGWDVKYIRDNRAGGRFREPYVLE